MPYRVLEVDVRSNPLTFRAEMMAHAASVREFTGSVYTEAAKGSAGIQMMGREMTIAGGAILGSLAASGAAFVGFESRMRNVSSISGEVRDNFKGSSDEILQLSRQVPQSANQLAEGLYQIASAGKTGADGVTILKAASLGAVAGMSDTSTAAGALVGALNAYGKEAKDVGDVNDILFQTVNVGVLTFGQLAQGMGQWVGIAAAAHVPLEDAAAAIAAMTRNGMQADETGFSLSQTIRSILDPSKELAALFQQLGFESGEMALKQIGLKGVIDAVGKASGGSAAEVNKYFSDWRAQRGVLTLLSGEGKQYAETQGLIADRQGRAGAAQNAYNEQSKSLANQLKLLRNDVMAAAISMGETMAPAIHLLAVGGKAVVDVFNAIPAPMRAFLVISMALNGTLLIGSGLALIYAQRMASLQVSLAAAGASGGVAATGIGLASTALSALTGIGIALTFLGGIAIGLKQVGEATRGTKVASEGVDDLKRALEELRNTGNVGGALSGEFGPALDGLHEKLQRIHTDAPYDKPFLNLVIDSRGLKDARGDIDAVDKALAAMVTGGHSDQAAASLKRLMDEANLSGRDRSRLKALLDDYAAATRNTKGANDDAAQSEKVLAAARVGGADAAYAEASANQTLSRSTIIAADATAKAKTEAGLWSSTVTGFLSGSKMMSSLTSETSKAASATKSKATADKEAADAARAHEQALQDVVDKERALVVTTRSIADAERAYADAQERLNRLLAFGLAEEREQLEISAERAKLDKEAAAAAIGVSEAKLKDIRELAQPDDPNAPRIVAEAERQLASDRLRLREATLGQTQANRALADSANGGQARELADAYTAVEKALTGIADANANVAKAQRELGDAIEKANVKTVESMDRAAGAMAAAGGVMKVTFDQWAAAEKQRHADIKVWWKNITDLAARGHATLAHELFTMGPEMGSLAADAVKRTDAELAPLETLLGDTARLGAQNAGVQLDAGLKALSGITALAGGEAGRAFATALDAGLIDLEAVITAYNKAVALGANAVITSVGGKPVVMSAADFQSLGRTEDRIVGGSYKPLPLAGGGSSTLDPHIAMSPAILYGERSTGGEAFIPRKGQKSKLMPVINEAASWYGMQVIPMAAGGVIPTPPVVGPGQFQQSAEALMAYVYNQAMVGVARRQIGAAQAGGSFAPGAAIDAEAGYRAILSHLDAAGLLYTVTSTTGGNHVKGSKHYQGKAVDLVGRGRFTMMDVFNSLAAPGGSSGPVKGIDELFFDPAGYYFDRGHYAKGQIGGHRDHVHAAVFDQGGWLNPGVTMAGNFTGKPEWVGPQVHNSGGSVINITAPLVMMPLHIAADADVGAVQRAVQSAVRPIVQEAFDRLKDQVGANPS